MNKPKILCCCLIFEPPIGGCERSTLNYLKVLSKDFDVYVICFLEYFKPFKKETTFIKDGICITQSNKPIEQAIYSFVDFYHPGGACIHMLK